MNGSSPAGRYADLLPYFQRLENYEAAHTPQRHRGGPVNVIDIPNPNPLVRRFLAAADTLGLPRCADFNGGDPEGFGPRQAAIRNGRRESGVTAYLNPVRHRSNLKIVTDALVTRVLFDGRRATGVEIERGGARSVVQARRECHRRLRRLRLAAAAAALRRGRCRGACNPWGWHRCSICLRSAKICMITRPRRFPCARPIPNPTACRGAPCRAACCIAAQYLLLRSGPLASNVFEANGFMRSRPELDRPDLQIIFMPAHRNANGHWLPRGHGYGIIFVNLRPASRGSVTLKSGDPHDKPAIDFNFLAAPG